MFGDADLAVIFGPPFGVPIFYNGAAGSSGGILDLYTDVYSSHDGPGGVESNLYVLRFPRNAFSSVPKPKDTISINGASFTVKRLPEQRDSRIIELYVQGTPNE